MYADKYTTKNEPNAQDQLTLSKDNLKNMLMMNVQVTYYQKDPPNGNT